MQITTTQPPRPERAPRDNRRIIRGVQFPKDGGGIETYTGDTPEQLDVLEAKMTLEQCEYLKQQGAIEGDWSPSGKAAPPMPGSRAAREQTKGQIDQATDEVERLRQRLAAFETPAE